MKKIVINFTGYVYPWSNNLDVYRAKIARVEKWCKDNGAEYQLIWPGNRTSAPGSDVENLMLPNRIRISEIDAIALQLAMDI